MSSRAYPRLKIEDFGRTLITSGDLDPLYIALHKAQLPREKLSRWLLAYWCLYNAGVASWLADCDDYWRYVEEAAANTTPAPTGGRWPRGAERRHWRGKQAIDSAVDLQRNRNWTADPALLVGWLAYGPTDGNSPTPTRVAFADVAKRVQTLRGFGPWISFKVADMLDRLGYVGVEFTDAEVFMFTDPRKAALMLARERLGLPDNAKLKDEDGAVKQAVAYLKHEFRDLQAPPDYARAIDLQEVETVLCKWKSHMNGHYPIGKDTIEIGEGLEEWLQHSDTARLIKASMPKGAN